jgi:WD40 repeat protein
VSAFDLGAEATGAAFVGDHAVFALGSGAVRVAEGACFELHDGPILAIAPHPDGKRLLTGGDDGKLMAVAPSGEVSELASFGSKWVDHLVANRNSGVVVAGVGKEAVVFKDDAESHRFAHPSSIGGLALDAKGRRLAVSHYGSATLRYALAKDDPGVALKWAGSHLAVTISPDADYVLTAMQELELHGWKLPEKQDLRMSGYSAKTRSFSWDRRGRWLATSGADCAVLWPFQGKTGPMKKSPAMLGRRDALVTRVAFHPRDETLAIGYADGLALAADLETGDVREIAARTGAPVSALAWSDDGRRTVIADEGGRALVAEG